MKKFSFGLLVPMILAFALTTNAQTPSANAPKAPVPANNIMDELNPFDPNIEAKLQELDREHEEETGLPSYIGEDGFGIPDFPDILFDSGCYRAACTVWARVVKSEQKLYLYINGNPQGEWDVSTGAKGYRTPDFDRHPNGRIYDKYSSKKFPGGDYNGMGNMPYAVFIKGGFAIHGTGQGNWKNLGRPASHGCIRLHPDNARYFNRLVREHGVKNVWITVE